MVTDIIEFSFKAFSWFIVVVGALGVIACVASWMITLSDLWPKR